MENYKKNKHIIARCNSWMKILATVTLQKYTGDTMSTAYWRIREGKGLTTYEDKKNLDTWNSIITQVRRFIASPLPLPVEEHEMLFDKRDHILSKMEKYRDWLEFGSMPVYLTDLSKSDYARYTLQFALNEFVSGKFANTPTAEEIANMWVEMQDGGKQGSDFADLITYDNKFFSLILEYKKRDEKSKESKAEPNVKEIVRYLVEGGEKLLPNDTNYYIRADNDHRSSVGAGINANLDWLYEVSSKSTDHVEIYEKNQNTIEDFRVWKANKKAWYEEQKKNGVKVQYDAKELLETITKCLESIIVPDFEPVKLDTNR